MAVKREYFFWIDNIESFSIYAIVEKYSQLLVTAEKEANESKWKATVSEILLAKPRDYDTVQVESSKQAGGWGCGACMVAGKKNLKGLAGERERNINHKNICT